MVSELGLILDSFALAAVQPVPQPATGAVRVLAHLALGVRILRPELLAEQALPWAELPGNVDDHGDVQAAPAVPGIARQAPAIDPEHRTGLGAWRYPDLYLPVECRNGRRAHRLEPDPVTAPVVRWMFAHRLAGRSAARITRALNDAGIPCPSAADPARNPAGPGTLKDPDANYCRRIGVGRDSPCTVWSGPGRLAPVWGVSALAGVMAAATVKSGGVAAGVRCCRRWWRTGCDRGGRGPVGV